MSDTIQTISVGVHDGQDPRGVIVYEDMSNEIWRQEQKLNDLYADQDKIVGHQHRCGQKIDVSELDAEIAVIRENIRALDHVRDIYREKLQHQQQ